MESSPTLNPMDPLNSVLYFLKREDAVALRNELERPGVLAKIAKECLAAYERAGAEREPAIRLLRLVRVFF